MSQPFIGQLLLVGFSFAPQGWAFCDGSIIPIADNDTLFNLIGTTYGGDGVNTFGLPDLRGRVPISQGQSPGTGNYVPGQMGGVEQVTVMLQQYPTHTHGFMCTSDAGGSNNAANAMLATGQTIYKDSPSLTNTMNAAMLSPIQGGNQPHDNMQPYLVCNWIISLFGIF